MQNQYPYSLLKRDERGYTILLLRDQQGLAFTAIAKKLGLSPSRVAQKYNQMKVKQKNLYIRQIAAEQMCENNSQIKRFFGTPTNATNRLPMSAPIWKKCIRISCASTAPGSRGCRRGLSVSCRPSESI